MTQAKYSYMDYKNQHRGSQRKGGKTEGEVIREEEKPQETLNYTQQTEGCWRGGVEGDGITG